MDKIIHQRTFKHTRANGTGLVVADAKLYSLGGNQRPYFSLTTTNGCDHERILSAMPLLKPLADLHLSNENGEPIHSVANAAHHLKETDSAALGIHLRIPESEARNLINEFTWYLKDALLEHDNFVTKARNDLLHRISTVDTTKYTTHMMYRMYISIGKWLKVYLTDTMFTDKECAEIGKLRKILGYKNQLSMYLLDRSSTSDIQGYYSDIRKLNTFLLKKVSTEHIKVSSYEVAQVYMKDIIDTCFLSYWKRQAEEAITLLTEEREEEPEAELTDDMFYIVLDGDTLVVEEEDIELRGDLPTVETGSHTLVIAESREAAGQVARDYWKDMAIHDKSEFTCMVGEDALINWALGESAVPGSTKVNSIEKWFDLWLTIPEEHLASYDGIENTVELSKGLAEYLDMEVNAVAYKQ